MRYDVLDMVPESTAKGKTNRQIEPKPGEPTELAQALIRCAGTGIYIVQDGKFQYVNSLFQEITGYSDQELVGKYSLDFVHPDDRETVRMKAIESIKGSVQLPYKYRFIKKNGETIWVLERVTSTEYKGRRATVGSFMDITEQKRLAEDLAKSEKRYRTILDEMQDAYFEIDLNGNFTFFNDSMCRAIGCSREELMGKDSRTYIPQEDIEPLYETLAEMYRTRALGKIIPHRFVNKDGNVRFVETRISPLRDDSGETIGFRAVSRDITERKELEQKLADMAARDQVTGLPNRISLSERLAVEIAKARRDNAKLAVMIADLDRFKTVNDSLGHILGDQLLKAAGQRLISLIRKSDMVARIGGDEFVLLIPEISKTADAIKVGQKILQAFRKPFTFGGHHLIITISIGIAIYPDDGEDEEALPKKADTAMYWAKEQGRDNCKLYQGGGPDTSSQSQCDQ